MRGVFVLFLVYLLYMKNSLEGVNVIRTQHHELTPHEAALYLVFTDDVRAAVAAYQKVVSSDMPRDFANQADAPFRSRVEEELKVVLERNNVTLKPVLIHGFNISLEQFVTEFTAHRQT